MTSSKYMEAIKGFAARIKNIDDKFVNLIEVGLIGEPFDDRMDTILNKTGDVIATSFNKGKEWIATHSNR